MIQLFSLIILIELFIFATIIRAATNSIWETKFTTNSNSPSSIYKYTLTNDLKNFDYYLNSTSNNSQLNDNSINNNKLKNYNKLNINNFNRNAQQTARATAAADCMSERLVIYKVILHTYWTRELFPKHYPDWQPPAQWTKTIGRSHDTSFALYHLGQKSTAGVKQFAETGISNILETQKQNQNQKQTQINITRSTSSSSSLLPSLSPSITLTSSDSYVIKRSEELRQMDSSSSSINDNHKNIFDEFSLPSITAGEGRAETKFFVDGNHSLVSLMTRIVPSPDWFIGLDSFQLCTDGSWIDSVTIEMDPLDAGTDNGFTFTAPNWPTIPQGVIYRITSRYPAHPASSFFYPKSKRLPPIATVQFIKLKEYELSEIFHFAEDDRKYETVMTQTHLETEHNHVEMNNELSASIEKERQNEVTPIPTSETEKDRIRAKLLAKLNPLNQNLVASKRTIKKNDKTALMESIAESYKNRKHRKRISKRPRNCRVSHWSDWSQCSQTCGVGEMHRYRQVIRHPKRGGHHCPPLKESKWCGSASGCHTPSSLYDVNWSSDT